MTIDVHIIWLQSTQVSLHSMLCHKVCSCEGLDGHRLAAVWHQQQGEHLRFLPLVQDSIKKPKTLRQDLVNLLERSRGPEEEFGGHY